jgi:hypothetical protein
MPVSPTRYSGLADRAGCCCSGLLLTIFVVIDDDGARFGSERFCLNSAGNIFDANGAGARALKVGRNIGKFANARRHALLEC